MPKVSKGRLSGVYGMDKLTSQELYLMAEEEERKIKDPENSDDPKWLKRRADRLKSLALKKEKAFEHKNDQS